MNKLINYISKDIGLYSPINGYGDNNRILNYDFNRIYASFKKYGDKVYNVWYDNDSFRFRGMKDVSIYDVFINNNSFAITELKEQNRNTCIKKIKFFDDKNKKSLTIENNYIDDHNKDEYLNIDINSNKLVLTTNDDISAVSTPDDENIKSILRNVLEVEESDIEESFNLINSSIPNFFNEIKYNFKILEKFNNLYDNDRLYAENIMNSFVYKKTKMN